MMMTLEATARADTRGLVGTRLSDVERSLILNTLLYCAGNRSRAARMLGVSLRTIRNKIREYGGDGCSGLASNIRSRPPEGSLIELQR